MPRIRADDCRKADGGERPHGVKALNRAAGVASVEVGGSLMFSALLRKLQGEAIRQFDVKI